MKTKYPSMFGLLAVLMLVASLVVPANLMSPKTAEADPGICKWDHLITPGYMPGKGDISSRSDILDMAVGGDGATVLLTARVRLSCAFIQELGAPFTTWCPAPNNCPVNLLYFSNNNGVSFSSSKVLNLVREHLRLFGWDGEQVYHVAIAPDNPNFWAVTMDEPGLDEGGPREVWITTNAGGKWECTNLSDELAADELIRWIDISVDYGGRRDIAVGTATGAGGGRVFVVKSTGFTGWIDQSTAPRWDLTGCDFFAGKFSPTYASDASLVLVYADVNNTYYNVSKRDIDTNIHDRWAFTAPGVEVATTADASPGFDYLNRVDLELPSDFSGQAASLRRAYISLDAYGAGAANKKDGIFRIDDTTVYVLMDTSGNADKSIYSIAYYGTYASGKLLAGERMGFPCTATVPTWFTDSPTTCPIPCWYPALKPTTGAACQAECTEGQIGNGGALVGWRADGKVAFAGTGSRPLEADANFSDPWETGTPIANDESAFAISRNNGETWNQTALIDTTITRFTDIAPTPDCKTIYLASVNANTTCCGFDSVWRTSSNAEVVAPYPALPLGIFWERVLTRVTADNCTATQTDHALLRIVPYCADPSGQIVGWGVYDHDQYFARGIAAWSPDYGDYWADISPRNPIQDFCFESKTVMYFLSPTGLVQKMPYTGTAWSTVMSDIDTVLLTAHTIAAYPEGKVIVGAGSDYLLYAVAYSGNFATDNPSFSLMSLAGPTRYVGNIHVAFHPAFKDNNLIFIAEENGYDYGAVYRNNVAAQKVWYDTNMMDPSNGAVGCPDPTENGQYGLVISFTGEALYSAGYNMEEETFGVWRTLDLLQGMPKPGIAWDYLWVGLEKQYELDCDWPQFTLEPSSLKACGCCTLDTDTTLYAIDNATYMARRTVISAECSPTGQPITLCQGGLVWAFTDCMAKKGPKLVTADKTLIGCDPVSGRAQEVNLCWEQLCVADAYDVEIAKDKDFTLLIIDFTQENLCRAFIPADVTKPCAYFPAGGSAMAEYEWVWWEEEVSGSSLAAFGNLECGHTYYWRVRVRECATGQWVRSPWSEVRSFTIKAGLPVTTPYYGPQLLSPNNGCLGCPVKPVSFSWSPFKETTKYKFQLAKDAAMTQIVKETEVTTTAYEYDGTLDYSANYFWRVMAVEPAPSDWSATFSFRTEAAPPLPPPPAPPEVAPLWVWVVAILGVILIVVTIVLIFKVRRV